MKKVHRGSAVPERLRNTAVDSSFKVALKKEMDDKSGDYTGATCLWRLDDR
jgi:hypothetical protein